MVGLWSSAAILGAALAFVAPIPGQSLATRPRFEVASIRPCRPDDGAGGGRERGRGGGGRNLTTSPGRLNVICMSVADLIDQYTGMFGEGDSPVNSGGASDVHPIRGGPAWAYSDRYTIHAETNDPAATSTVPDPLRAGDRLMIGPMLHSLVEDRFHLRTHRETEDVPMYALTVAKRGPKIKPSKAGDCIPPDPSKQIWDQVKVKPVCGTTYGGVRGPNRTWDLGEQPMSKFTGFPLSSSLDRQVIDKTGLTGLYSFHLEFASDDTTPGRAPVDPNSDIPPLPPLFTALQQQLGLKLESVKGPRGYIVIDQLERPSEN